MNDIKYVVVVCYARARSRFTVTERKAIFLNALSTLQGRLMLVSRSSASLSGSLMVNSEKAS